MKGMQTSQINQLKQYARVARTFPKVLTSVANARIKVIVPQKS